MRGRSYVIPLCLFVGLALMGGRTAQAQQQPTVITGHVRGADGEPISQAQVVIQAVGASASTDAHGAFRLVVPASRALGQTVTLQARRLGSQPE